MNVYPLGTTVTVASAFALGNPPVPTDPTTVTLRYKDPNGNETVLSGGQLTHAGPGIFTLNITGMIPGVWYYRFEGTGTVLAVQEANFVITNSQFPDAQP